MEMTHVDPKAANTSAKPGEVLPRAVSGSGRVDGEVLTVRRSRLSWNVIRLAPVDGKLSFRHSPRKRRAASTIATNPAGGTYSAIWFPEPSANPG